MSRYIFSATAKINLSLDLTRKREDGYHDLLMIMQSIGLYDTITLTESSGSKCAITNNFKYLPRNKNNLALAAAELFISNTGLTHAFEINLEKRIPVSAGLGGGSADAAAVLIGLRNIYAPELPMETLSQWALTLGSDVPFCLAGGTQQASGRGEVLKPLPPLPDCNIVISKPMMAISTAHAFGMMELDKIQRRPDMNALTKALDEHDLYGVCKNVLNVFEEPVMRVCRDIAVVKNIFLQNGALCASMTGTGSAVFSIFDDNITAQKAYDTAKRDYRDTFIISHSASR